MEGSVSYPCGYICRDGPGCQTPTLEIATKCGRRKDGWEFMFTDMGKERRADRCSMGADLLAAQVPPHGALLCIKQPRSSTVSLRHPASPSRPSAANALKRAVEWQLNAEASERRARRGAFF